ncbi:MAG: DUF2442 domain-containing protein [Marinilabiliaceae bacterium]|nr:DUF2442 domain-containing protein [Marinilabiliaceae bacterium]
MYLGIKEVLTQENYNLLLTFENDEKRIFDMKPYLDVGPVFKELKNIEMFKTARVCFKTIAWANEADIDPEVLYPLSSAIKN